MGARQEEEPAEAEGSGVEGGKESLAGGCHCASHGPGRAQRARRAALLGTGTGGVFLAPSSLPGAGNPSRGHQPPFFRKQSQSGCWEAGRGWQARSVGRPQASPQPALPGPRDAPEFIFVIFSLFPQDTDISIDF